MLGYYLLCTWGWSTTDIEIQKTTYDSLTEKVIRVFVGDTGNPRKKIKELTVVGLFYLMDHKDPIVNEDSYD